MRTLLAMAIILALPRLVFAQEVAPKPVSLEYYQQRVGTCDLQGAQLAAENASLRQQLDQLRNAPAPAPVAAPGKNGP